MRINLPVTQRNVEISDNQRLISVTNRDGLIVFANKAFCDISGYTIGELLNQPHNLIRHPDMPVAVFADMWGTLEAGLPWSGLLKNRCKNGDHYWVRANMTPTRRAGELTGYMSVRIKPSPEDVEFAEQLYRRLQEGKDTSIFLDKGIPSVQASLPGGTCADGCPYANESLPGAPRAHCWRPMGLLQLDLGCWPLQSLPDCPRWPVVCLWRVNSQSRSTDFWNTASHWQLVSLKN
ncbi:PAS domain-containing protein [Ralstonia insidiosa]|uniref:PAS domain-containing protein n=1 Tax=Ralstonia insidiosa TaxID=190721 RepID=UPI000CEF0321|nr:PAS domain-containing protein [Ralstonia insidiosa]